MTHHHHDHDTAGQKPRRKYGFWTVFLVLVVLLVAILGAVWVNTSSESATEREDAERGVERSKNLATLQAADQATLTTYGWNDKAKGVVRIPVDRAMDLVIPEINARSTKAASSANTQL
jgi:flagellar basal body-associated protein FliL